ncbi:DEAD/DEAH box helicase [Paraprevotella clara]|uniref:DEAD/DEAH box helicase n=1 Tax=Paraprevotella clara TaxID=454154 RepID=UPI002674A2A6|nr:DEAD/DEAH box helicase [Paraprevotella clara]
MLRKYQHTIKHFLFSEWAQHSSIMIQMPTGTGKTHLLASVIYDHLKEGQYQCVWIVAHRRELVEQIEETVARYGISKSDERMKVMSIQWLSRHWEDVKDERPSLIVIDEAHHALAETYKELWTRYPNAKKLGMTATPCRLNRKGFTDLFDMLIISDSIADFIRQGWLSAFDYVSIRPNSEDQRLIDCLEKRGADGDFQVKEMDAVLNRRPSIERLYESVRQYANGKKGIVYAVSISHARNIAEYYNNKGVNAVAIDSKTPAKLRKQMVEDFRQGKIQVLVNVDVFSEGFDCPDVEFIQLARPTLSLAKYLQQVGRGLRKTDGKESCMIIDNVGLYRLFGLPTADRDWQAMFEGRLAGKGYPATNARTGAYMTATQTEDETVETVGQLETIVSHGQLLEYLRSGASLPESNGNHSEELKSFKDRQSGLWGLRQGRTITATAQYLAVSDIRDGLAAVKFKDNRVGIVDGNGNIRMKLNRYRYIKFLPDDIGAVTDNAGHTFYIDLKTTKLYNGKPEVLKYGRIEMLRIGMVYYSRTKHVYKSPLGINSFDLLPRGFYLRIYTGLADNCKFRHIDSEDAFLHQDCVCILADDEDEYYGFCGELADGSIVITDGKGNYYHAMDGKEKQYIACEHTKTQDEDFDVAVLRLKAEAEGRAAKMKADHQREKEKKQQMRLAKIQDAVPFQSGLKWGLRAGSRVIVPPIYRSIQNPVGNYCVVETNPRQWGIIRLDGKVVVEARYTNVEISNGGTARLTVFPGITKTVNLK